MEEKFNNEQEERHLDNFKNTKTTRRREKKNVKSWLFGQGGCLFY